MGSFAASARCATGSGRQQGRAQSEHSPLMVQLHGIVVGRSYARIFAVSPRLLQRSTGSVHPRSQGSVSGRGRLQPRPAVSAGGVWSGLSGRSSTHSPSPAETAAGPIGFRGCAVFVPVGTGKELPGRFPMRMQRHAGHLPLRGMAVSQHESPVAPGLSRDHWMFDHEEFTTMESDFDLSTDPGVLAAFTLVEAREAETRRRLRAFLQERGHPQTDAETTDYTDQIVDELRLDRAHGSDAA